MPAALDRFLGASSESRRHLAEEVRRTSGLLAALAEGATAVDRSLRDAAAAEAPGA
jgi:hypothetical protein